MPAAPHCCDILRQIAAVCRQLRSSEGKFFRLEATVLDRTRPKAFVPAISRDWLRLVDLTSEESESRDCSSRRCFWLSIALSKAKKNRRAAGHRFLRYGTPLFLSCLYIQYKSVPASENWNCSWELPPIAEQMMQYLRLVFRRGSLRFIFVVASPVPTVIGTNNVVTNYRQRRSNIVSAA